MSKEYPQIAEYIKTVPYPGEKPPEQRNPDGTLKKREPVPDDSARASGRSDSESGARAERRAAAAGPRKRIDPQAPFLNSIYDAGVWWNTSEPDLTFFDVTPGKPRDLPLYRGGNLGTPTDPAPRGFPLVLAKTARRLHERLRTPRARREDLHRRRAAERARDRQPRVGLAFRQASRRHAERLRHPGAAADASRAARRSVGAVHRERLVA